VEKEKIEVEQPVTPDENQAFNAGFSLALNLVEETIEKNKNPLWLRIWFAVLVAALVWTISGCDEDRVLAVAEKADRYHSFYCEQEISRAAARALSPYEETELLIVAGCDARQLQPTEKEIDDVHVTKIQSGNPKNTLSSACASADFGRSGCGSAGAIGGGDSRGDSRAGTGEGVD